MQDLVECKKNRWDKIDILRFICSVLVVYFHTGFSNNVGYAITAISRVGVPLFFMISGFFFMNSASREKENKKRKNTFKLILIGSIIYSLLWLFAQVVAGREIIIMLGQQFEYKKWINMFIWNQPLFGEHLWYLFAYWNILLVMPVLKYQKLRSYCIFFIVGNLILGNYAPMLLGKSLPLFLSRNWLFTGIPFVCLGVCFFQKKEYIMQRMNTKLIWVGIILVGICSIIEAAWLRKEYGAPAGDVYISTIFFAGFVFAGALDDKCVNNKMLKVLAVIGRRYTLWIYLLHPLVSVFLDKVFEIVLGVQPIYSKAIIVYLITLVIVVVFEKIASLLRLVFNTKSV